MQVPILAAVVVVDHITTQTIRAVMVAQVLLFLNTMVRLLLIQEQVLFK